MKKKYIITALLIILLVSSALFLSRSLAKKAGNTLMEPASSELKFLSCRPSLLYFKDGHPVSKTTGIGWKVAYNTDEYFIIHDIEVYTLFTGKIVATNPTDLKSRIHDRYKLRYV